MNKNNISLIIGREYWTRVKSKMFLITTFLAPLGIVLIYGVLGYLMTRGSDKIKNIAIIDNAGLTTEADSTRKNLTFDITSASLDDLFKQYKEGAYDGIIELPPIDANSPKYDIIYHADKTLAIDETSAIEGMFRKRIRNFKVKNFGIDESQLAKIDTDINVDPRTITDKEKSISSLTNTVSSGVGLAVGVLLFMVILMFGSQVMRGVNEEKINRIVEVLVSSVKPLDLMIGKVVGIGLVGLTQFAIWGILLTVLGTIGMTMFGIDPSGMDATTVEMTKEALANPAVSSKVTNVMKEIFAINWALIIPLYFVFFFVGYMIYASMFAAVGAAAGDDINEAQTLTTLAMLPLMAAFYIAMSAARAPDSTLAVWSSIFPLTSPVVMPVRLATEPPMWQIGLSVLLGLLFVGFMIWLASRIYRIGILMYGKKASIKELGKWIFAKA